MKKQSQLGMNPGTASGRLVKDLLFKFVRLHHPNCFRCGQPLTRETFSIEHKTPWLDSDKPLELFFDLDNIDFSHHSCNVKAGRKPPKKYNTPEEKRQAQTELERLRWQQMPKEEQQLRRRRKYLLHGK